MISSEFLTRRVVQEYPVPRGKISIVAILDFSGKGKIVNILKTIRESDFEQMFDPQGSTRVSNAKG